MQGVIVLTSISRERASDGASISTVGTAFETPTSAVATLTLSWSATGAVTVSEKPKLTAPGLATSSLGGIVTTGQWLREERRDGVKFAQPSVAAHE